MFENFNPKIVVARYNEDIQWTEHFDNVTIYNKGESLPEKYNAIPLENTGRDSHTFFTHIVRNYENLDDFTVFLQGDPFDHMLGIMYSPQRALYYQANPEQKIIDLKKQLTPCFFKPLSSIRVWESFSRMKKTMPTIHETLTRIFPNLPENFSYEYAAGAEYIASKETLRKYPKEFYESLLEEWNYSEEDYKNWEDGGRMMPHPQPNDPHFRIKTEEFAFEHANSFMYLV